MPATDPNSYDANDLARLMRAGEQLHEALIAIDAAYQKIHHHRMTPRLGKTTARLVVAQQKLNEIMRELRRELS